MTMWGVRASMAVAASALFAAPALAQDPAAAATLFDQGLSAMQAGRYAEGCPALEESYRLEPLAGVLFTSAECHAKWGKLATAVARYQDYLTAFARMPPSQVKKQGDRDQIAKRQLQALDSRVSKLTLVLPDQAPADTKVTRDGVVLRRPSLGVALPVDAGEHVLVTEVPGGSKHEQHVSIAEGEARRVMLEVELPKTIEPKAAVEPRPTAVDRPTQKPSQSSSRATWTWIAAGVGVVGLAVGSVSGALVFSKKSEVEANCRGIDCNPQGKAAADSASTLGLVSTIGFAAGGAGVVTAVVLLLTAPGDEHAARRLQPTLAGDARSAVLGLKTRF